ncbi:MAG: hypothetical protein ACI4Q4_09990 [Oscillospiraceae bacterium]
MKMQPYERYTKPTSNYGVKGVGLNTGFSEYDAICMLSKYEDTGFSPDEFYQIISEWRRLRELCDKLLPCMIGDTWYITDSENTRVITVIIKSIAMYEIENRVIIQSVDDPGDTWIMSIDDFKRSATKDRALLEKSLAKMARIRQDLKCGEDNE